MTNRSDRWLRLEIDPVIRRAEHLAERVQRELSDHAGLIRAAAGVVHSASEAKRVARALHRPWSLHRLPAYFLAVALVLFSAWVYWQFFHVSTLSIALPVDDAVHLAERLAHGGRIRFQQITTQGSRESVALLQEGRVDLAFVQGGIPLSWKGCMDRAFLRRIGGQEELDHRRMPSHGRRRVAAIYSIRSDRSSAASSDIFNSPSRVASC